MKKRHFAYLALTIAAAFALCAVGGFTRTAGADTGTGLAADELFTERDLNQAADTQNAQSIALTDDMSVTIDAAGVYVLTGEARNATVTVQASKDDKVQLVLDGLTVENDGAPCIEILSADKVFLTLTDSENALSVTGDFTTESDAVICSKDDLVLGGPGTLRIASTRNAVSCGDDLKITGGTYLVTAGDAAFEANDSICIADGVIRIGGCVDGLHAENGDDAEQGYVFISGGTVDITAQDDAIHADSVVQIEGGALALQGREGIEGTYIRIDGGTVDIAATDDGINAGRKSSAYTPTVEINAGAVTIVMVDESGDGIDANGDIRIRGGSVAITAENAFDFDGQAEHIGGEITVNGAQIDAIVPGNN